MKGCPAWQILGLNFARGKIHALLSLGASMSLPSALPSGLFWQRFLSGAVMSVASIAVEDEDGAVFAGDLDRLAGFGALVEQVEPLLRIVVWNPFANRLPGRLDGLEGLIRPPRPAGSPCGLRLRLRPKRLRSLGVFRYRMAARAAAED